MIKQNKLSLIALHKEIEALKTQSTPSNKTKINSVLVEGYGVARIYIHNSYTRAPGHRGTGPTK